MTSTFSSISLAAAASAAALLLAACAANPGTGFRPGAGAQPQAQVEVCSGEPARGVPTWRWTTRRDGTCEAG